MEVVLELAEWIIAAIEWAVDNQMEIVNLSLQGPDLESLHIACDNAYNAGHVLLVAAGGNTHGGSVSLPGSIRFRDSGNRYGLR